MNRLYLLYERKKLAEIKSWLEQAQRSLGTACEPRHNIESDLATGQSQYNQPNRETYGPSGSQQTYEGLNQAAPGIFAATGQINESLNSLHSMGNRIQSAMREQKGNRRQHDQDARNLESGAAHEMRGGLPEVDEVIRTCETMLGEISALTKSARHSLSLVPDSSPTQRRTIDALVGDTAGVQRGKYTSVLNDMLYLMKKNPQYLVAPPAVPHLGTSGTQRSGTIWDKVNYGGANLKYRAIYKRYVDISPDTRRMMNVGYNLQNTNGMYTVGKMHEKAEIDYGRY